VGNFVGAPVISMNNKLDLIEKYQCPAKCRKKPEWLYC